MLLKELLIKNQLLKDTSDIEYNVLNRLVPDYNNDVLREVSTILKELWNTPVVKISETQWQIRNQLFQGLTPKKLYENIITKTIKNKLYENR